jgi:hypothetical protein
MKALAIIMLTLAGIAAQGQKTRLEDLHGKTILLFTPHPDDDVFWAAARSPYSTAIRASFTSLSIPMTTRARTILK